jgi:arylsulfatase A-like enzyme
MDRRDFLKLGSAAAVTSSLPLACQSPEGGSQQAPADQPNIILVYTDDLGNEDLGCYGGTEIDTPRIDQLAEEGMMMTQVYCPSPVCTPARSGTLTGRYPHRNGLFEMIRNEIVNYDHRYEPLNYIRSPEMTQGLDERELTIGNLLQDAGYTTGVVGKWDSGQAPRYLPLQRGFDFFYGFANTGIDYYTHERYGVPSMYSGNDRITDEGYATTLFRDKSVQFIRDNQDNPFFLYVPFNAPHGSSNLDGQSHQAPDEFIEIYGEPPGTEDMRYKAKVTCLDAAVGEILETLDELGLRENTLFIFTNDHGGYNNGQLRGGKANMYEGGLRTPFIARWPGRISEGVTSSAFCSHLDLVPTFLSAAGVDRPNGRPLDGYDLLPVLTGESESPRDRHFWEWRAKRAVRIDDWKWVLETDDLGAVPDPEATGELYNLTEDVEEQNNLAAANPEKLRELKGAWEAWIRDMAATPERGPFSKGYYDLLGYGTTGYDI